MIRVRPVLICVSLCLASPLQAEELMGFESSEAQRTLEVAFSNQISAGDQRVWSKQLSLRPHHAGSDHTRQNVEYMADLFREWGFAVEVERFQILLPVPVSRSLELLSPGRYVAALEEDIVDSDPSTAQKADVLAPYNAFSKDGDVTGELVFVNYGIPEDYELLERYGVDVRGRIVIAKYGKSWRGIKPKLAAENGAIGALIYSDPADDGYAQGDVYPKGAFKNESGVQRGSVMDMPQYPGDVLTPGKPAVKGTRRLKIEAAPTITRIPVLPISHRDALPLLAALDGEVVPAEWRGALPITYHLGPGPAQVRLAVAFDWQTITIENVVARLEGSEFPDEWVLRGNHHDGWNHGAADPISGMVALLSEAKAVGALAREGNRPRRTIVYTAWDAEEPGLIGSTEWVEKHRPVLLEKAVAYLNTDGNSRGFVSIGGSHTLEPFFNQVMGSVVDPQTQVSVDKRLRAAVAVNGSKERKEEIRNRPELRIFPLGSGSDYTPFLQHAGIASANLAFGGEGRDGSYHTLYDTYTHFANFRDPDFSYGVALSNLAGIATLRLANARVLPFRFGGLADNLTLYLDELETLADTQRTQAEEINELLANGSYELALDPRKTLIEPEPKKEVPHFNFAPLKNAVEAVNAAAASLDSKLPAAAATGVDLTELNARLYKSERALTSDDGLPGRDWYRHQIYAPGFYTGYGVKTLPRVRESIEAELYEEVDHEIAYTANVLEAFAGYLSEMERLLENSTD